MTVMQYAWTGTLSDAERWRMSETLSIDQYLIDQLRRKAAAENRRFCSEPNVVWLDLEAPENTEAREALMNKRLDHGIIEPLDRWHYTVDVVVE